MFPKSMALMASLLNSARAALGMGVRPRSSSPVGDRVKRKNRRMKKEVRRTSVEMLRRRAVGRVVSDDGKTMRYVRGKLIGGQPRLWRS